MTKPASLTMESHWTSRQAQLDALQRRAARFVNSHYWHQAFVVLALIREAIGGIDESAAGPNVHALLLGAPSNARAPGGATARVEAYRPSITLLASLVETLEILSGTRVPHQSPFAPVMRANGGAE